MGLVDLVIDTTLIGCQIVMSALIVKNYFHVFRLKAPLSFALAILSLILLSHSIVMFILEIELSASLLIKFVDLPFLSLCILDLIGICAIYYVSRL
jgi:hypothetical protein